MRIVVDMNRDLLIIGGNERYENGQEYPLKHPKAVSEALEIVLEALHDANSTQITLEEINEDIVRTVFES